MASGAVQLAHQAPQSPFAIEHGGDQALEAFYEVTDKAGFPRHATILKWGGMHEGRYHKPAHMGDIAKVMEEHYDKVNWEFIHELANWSSLHLC